MASPQNLSSSSSFEPDWAWLPENVIFLIVSHLFLLSDIISFGSVCTHWNSVSKHRLQILNISPGMFFNRRLPMLLIPTGDRSESTRNLYSLPDAGVYHLKLSVPYNNRCIGSSHGWLIFIESLSFVITLFNPFYFGNSKGTINLPPFLKAIFASETMQVLQRNFFSDYFICKAILSADPSSCADYIIVVIYGKERRLAYYKSGDETWSYMYQDQPVVYDIINHQGYFLVVNFWGEVYVCDVMSNNRRFKLVTEPVVGPVGESTRRYIVESSDGSTLLQAVRLVHSTDGKPSLVDTLCFVVYKLVAMNDEKLEWIPVDSIGNGALFLGDNYSTYVKSSDFPHIISNSIYFTDDYHGVSTMHQKPYQACGHHDDGIYLIRDKSIFHHYISCPEQKNLPPPIWILPTI